MMRERERMRKREERESSSCDFYARRWDGMVWKGAILSGDAKNVCLFTVTASLINFLLNF